ncbi:MAG: gliding motility-associated C-terminal domain-containing protein [Bacteroidales bacterium]
MLWIRIKILFVFVVFSISLVAQDEFIMTTSSHQSATSDYCHVFDDGGKDLPYSQHVTNSTYTITSSDVNARFRIIWNVNISADASNSKLEILDGDKNSTNILETVSGVSQKRIYSTTNKVTIRFNATDDTPKEGFDIILIACSCLEPSNIKSESLGKTKVKLSWDSPYSDMNWTVDYVLDCQEGSANNCLGDLSKVLTVYTANNFLEIEGLEDYGDHFAYDIYGTCGTMTACGTLGMKDNPCTDITTEQISFDTIGKKIIVNWTQIDQNTKWYIKTNFLSDDIVTLDTNYWEYYYGDTCGNFEVMVASGKDNSEPIWCKKAAITVDIACPCTVILPDTVYVKIDSTADILLLSWEEDKDDIIWYVKYAGQMNQLTEPRYEIPLSCSERFIIQVVGDTLNNKDGLCTFYVIDTTVIYPCADVQNIYQSDVTANSVTIKWDMVNPKSKSFVVRCFDSKGNKVYGAIIKDTNSVTIKNLENYTKYMFKVSTICPNNRISCGVTTNIRTKYDDCLDFTNLQSSALTFTHGSYDNPYLQYGSYMDDSLYWVCKDTGAKDNLTSMNIVPIGEKASIKLGNHQKGRCAESAAYTYLVDTNQYDMLLLKYAIVTENANHNNDEQPRFFFEILDQYDNLIDNKCGYANFYTEGDTGWNTVNEMPNIIWKDYTTIGIDIAPYHNKQIKVRLTTSDCNDGEHFCYAYYNLICSNKKLKIINSCLQDSFVTLIAPEGFSYRWFKENSTDTISEQSEVVVPADNSKYYCLLSFLNNKECNILLETNAINVKPKAHYSYVIDTCLSKINFTSTSSLAYDKSYGAIVGQSIDSVFWILDNGKVYCGEKFSYIYSQNGMVHIKMVVTMTNSQCRDTVDINLYIDQILHGKIIGKKSICLGDTLILNSECNIADVLYLWKPSAWGQTITVVPTMKDTSYCVSFYYNGKCKGTAYHNVEIFPTYNDTVYDTICKGQVLSKYGFGGQETGIYINKSVSRYGCDSITVLYLKVFDSYYDTIIAKNCDEGYYLEGFIADTSGVYIQDLKTEYGCDSIKVLNFTLGKSFHDTISAQIYKGQTYTDSVFSETDKGVYTVAMTTQEGCDSVYVLDLDVVELKFPTVITPNNDGINDLFEIGGILQQTFFDEIKLTIYNRYGKLIFTKNKFLRQDDFWNPNETNTPSGTYFYRFTAKSKKKDLDFTGIIEVIK